MTRNVVLLCLDSVRYDYYVEYASRLHSRAETTFDRCYAASGWSMPSHASLFTERLPHKHGIHPREQFTFSHLSRDETFLGRLQDHTTIGISANGYANSNFGFDELFDLFVDYTPNVLFLDGLHPRMLRSHNYDSTAERYLTFLQRSLTHSHPIKSLANGLWGLVPQKCALSKSRWVPYSQHDDCERIADLARDELAGLNEPFLLFINAMDAHANLRPIPQYDDTLYDVRQDWHSNDKLRERESQEPFENKTDLTNYRELYRAAVDYLDRTFVPFVEELLNNGDYETTVLVFSDHGENLGYPSDDYLFGHNSLSNAVLHTPGDIINPPSGFPETVNEPVSHLQFGEIIEAIAYDEEFPTVERSHVPAEAPRAGALRRSDEPGPPHMERMVRALVTTDHRVEWDSLGTSKVYELRGGFPEEEHLIEEGSGIPDEAAEFFEISIEAYLQTLDDTTLAVDQIDAATEQRLEELGYL